MDQSGEKHDGTFARNLYFVSSQDNHCKKSIRKHVMLDYICKKRAQDHMRMRFLASPPFRWRRIDVAGQPVNAPTSNPVKNEKEEVLREQGKRTERTPPPRRIVKFGNQRATSSTSGVSEKEFARVQNRFLGQPSPVTCPKGLVDSPESVLGAGRTNAFSTYPVKDLDNYVDMLVDHFLFVIGPSLSGFHMNAKFNPQRDLSFRVSIEDPSAFHALLAFTACHLDALHGKRPGQRAIFHMHKAIRNISDRLCKVDDAMIFAASCLCGFESYFGRQEASQSHYRGIQAMVAQRGGFMALNPRVQMLLTWCMITDPKISVAYSPTIPLETSSYRQRRHTELATFFDCVHTLSTMPSSLYQAEASAFKPGTPLFALLSGPAGWEGPQRSHAVSSESLIRLAALLYIHLVFLDHRVKPTAMTQYLERLQLRLVENGLDKQGSSGSLIPLIWLLIKADREVALESPSNAWMMARMVNLITVSKPTALEKIMDLLLDTLTCKMYVEAERFFLSDVI